MAVGELLRWIIIFVRVGLVGIRNCRFVVWNLVGLMYWDSFDRFGDVWEEEMLAVAYSWRECEVAALWFLAGWNWKFVHS